MVYVLFEIEDMFLTIFVLLICRSRRSKLTNWKKSSFKQL